MEGNSRDPSHLRVQELWGSGSGTPHYCPDVPHAMSKSGLSGLGQ